MKKIERIEQGGSITVVHTEHLDQLENTIEELVEFLIGEAMSLSPPMRNYRGAAYYRVKDKLETLTGKTWEELKGASNG